MAKHLSLIHVENAIHLNPEELDDESGIVSFRGKRDYKKSAMFEKTMMLDVKEE